MSPLLGKEGLPEPFERKKFVRVGETIVYDELYINHSKIAASHELEEPVDDAGQIADYEHCLYVTMDSTTLATKGNPAESRNLTG